LPSNFLPVPVVRQRRGFSCGPAAVLSLLRLWCHEAYATVEEEALYAPLETTEARGTEPEPMVRLLVRSGVDARYRHGDVTTADLERAVDAGAPPILDLQAWRDHDDKPWRETWDAGHYVIMVGYDDERLFFVDPSNVSPAGYVYMPRPELEERWHDLTGNDDAPVRRMTIFARGSHAQPPSASPHTQAARLG
jgi:predicted double-glycine peptidase